MIRTKDERIRLAEARVVRAAVRWVVADLNMKAAAIQLDAVDRELRRAVRALLKERSKT